MNDVQRAMVKEFQRHNMRHVAFGGLTPGNLVALMSDVYPQEDILEAYEALEKKGILEVFNLRGVKHATLRSSDEEAVVKDHW